MNFILKIIVTSLSIFFSSWLLTDVHIDSYPTAIWVALVIALLNVFLKPILILLTIPVTFLTFGLFLLVINAIIVYVADYFVKGFYIDGFFTAFILSLLISVLNYVMEWPAMKARQRQRQRNAQ